MSDLLVSIDDIDSLTTTLDTVAAGLSSSSMIVLALTNRSAIFGSAAVVDAVETSAGIQRLRIDIAAAGIEALAVSGDEAGARLRTEDKLLSRGLI